MAATRAQVTLPCSFDNGTFARYKPFADDRQVVARRGREMGFDYGSAKGRRRVAVGENTFELVEYEDVLTCGAGTIRCELLRLPDAELLFPKGVDGFSDAEIEHILASVKLVEA